MKLFSKQKAAPPRVQLRSAQTHPFSLIDSYATTLTVEWETINLQDEVEEAKAALYLAQRDKIYWEEGKSNEDH